MLTEHCPDYQHNVYTGLLKWFDFRYHVLLRRVPTSTGLEKSGLVGTPCTVLQMPARLLLFSFFIQLKIVNVVVVLIDEVIVAILVEGPAICFAG